MSNFFHSDCMSSKVRLNVDLDTVLTVLTHGLLSLVGNTVARIRPSQTQERVPQVRGDLRNGQGVVVQRVCRSGRFHANRVMDGIYNVCWSTIEGSPFLRRL